jgi:hypothetical protein
VLEHVAAGELHLTGLLLLGPHLTEDNHRELLAAARHRTKCAATSTRGEFAAPKPRFSSYTTRTRTRAEAPTRQQTSPCAAGLTTRSLPSKTSAATSCNANERVEFRVCARRHPCRHTHRVSSS